MFSSSGRDGSALMPAADPNEGVAESKSNGRSDFGSANPQVGDEALGAEGAASVRQDG
jgi:hypothetical protein